MTMRIHELAKELGISSKSLIERLAKLKVTVKNHMSTVDEETIKRLRRASVSATSPAPARVHGGPGKPAVSRPAVPTKPAAPAVVPPAKPAAPAPTVARSTPVKPTLPPPKAPTSPPAAAPPPAPTAPPKVEPRAPAAQPAAPVHEAVAVAQAAPPPTRDEAIEAPKPKILAIQPPVTVKELAEKLGISASELIKQLIKLNVFATINQQLDAIVIEKVAKELGCELEALPSKAEAALRAHDAPDAPGQLVPRAPVVTFMGHVDHGKTSLLDYIRQSRVAEREAGGITQHIGAYEMTMPKGKITFLDTPGHEAFTAMRARGASATDIVVLVVAADDGVMPQTVEALDHAKAAGAPIVVAMNKIDKPEANPDRVKQQLMQHELVSEEWGGKTIIVPVSAKTGEGVPGLLEMILLEAELLELKANPNRPAKGVVIEGELTRGGGPIATLLVTNGTLKVGDLIVAGSSWGRIRAMLTDRGERHPQAGPAMPVEVLGLNGVPQAGELFYVVEDEREAREIVEERVEALRHPAPRRHITLQDLYQEIRAGKLKAVKLIVKADVHGSVEALRDSLVTLSNAEVNVQIIHAAVGDINESDVLLASASDAVIIGFHVGLSPEAAEAVQREKVEVRQYDIIYDAIASVKKAIVGLLEPEQKEVWLGRARVKQVFKVSKTGIVAGCLVEKGKVPRNAQARLFRGKEQLVETKIASLKRFKDDVREVAEGYECGISLANWTDVAPDDLIEAFQIQTIERT